MKSKINDEIDLIEFAISIWKYRLIISIIIIVSALISFLFLENINNNKPQYQTTIQYELNLLPSLNVSNCRDLQYSLKCEKNFTNKILSRIVKKNFGIKLIFISDRQIKFLSNDEVKFDDIFKKSNDEITNIISDREIMAIDYITKIYTEIGVELQKNQKYIDSIFLSKRVISFINDGIKVYNFKNIITTKIKYPYLKLIKLSILISSSIGVLFVLRKLINKRLKKTSSKKVNR